MKKMILAANWKLHKSPAEVRAFLEEFLPLWKPYATKHEAWFFPPAVVLEAFSQKAEGLSFGPQNFWKEESGAFTGETSLAVAKELGASVALIGHSERRQIFGETSALLKEKLNLALKLGVKPLLCVGETLEERKSGQTVKVVRSQLESVLKDLGPVELAVAYEPVWAIGTGEVATPEQAAEVHQEIRKFLKELWGDSQIPILYGGSVKPSNAKELFSQEEIGGFLVGGASLDPTVFLQILTETLP